MELLTPAEWLDVGIPDNHVVWIHGLDLVKHCLQGDVKQTFLQDKNPSVNRFHEWQDGMQERTEATDNFDEIMDNTYKFEKRWESYSDDSGDLYVSDFIAGEDLPFDAWRRRLAQKPAVSMVMDTFIPWFDRDQDYVTKWHEKIYNIVAQCASEQRPCRVISVHAVRSGSTEDNMPGTNPMKIFSVIKDYDDPIFPAIWGTYTNNFYANAFLNVVADYFLGIHDLANGYYSKIPDLRSYFPEDEEIIFFSERSKLD